MLLQESPYLCFVLFHKRYYPLSEVLRNVLCLVLQSPLLLCPVLGRLLIFPGPLSLALMLEEGILLDMLLGLVEEGVVKHF